MADGNTVVIELAVKAPGAKEALGEVASGMDLASAAAQKLTATSDAAQAAISRTTAVMTQSIAAQGGRFTSMAAAVDPVLKAQLALESATIRGTAALAAGRTTQDLYNSTLAAYTTRVAEAEKGTTGFFASVGGLTSAFKSLAAGLGIGFGLAELAKLPGMLLGVVQSTAGIAHVAETVGVTTAQLQELRYAGSQVQISTETMDSALEKFSKNLGLAAQGTGALSAILKANHVVVSGDLMKDFLTFGGLVENTSNAEQRNTLITAAFGKSVEELGLVFKHGPAGVQASIDAFVKLGGVIADPLITETELLNQKLNNTWQSLSTVGTKVLLDFALHMDAMATKTNALSDSLNKLLAHPNWDNANEFLFGKNSIDQMQQQIAMLRASAAQMGIADPKPNSYLGAQIAALQKQIDAAKGDLVDRPAAGFVSPKTVGDLAAALPVVPHATIVPDVEREKQLKAFESATSAIEKQTVALNAQAGALGLGVGAAAAFEKEQELINEAVGQGTGWFVPHIETIHKVAAAFGEAKMRLAEYKAASDATFAAQKIGLAPIDAKVADVLHSLYGDAWLKHQGDAIAGQIRFNEVAAKVSTWSLSIEQGTRALHDQAAVIGLGAGAAAEFAKRQEMVNYAIENHITLSNADLANINKLASAYGAATTALERLKLTSDVGFDTALLSLSDREASIATKLRGIYGSDVPAALRSTDAAALRVYDHLKDIHDVSASIKTSLTGAIAGIFSGATKSGADMLTSLTKGLAAILAGKKPNGQIGHKPAGLISLLNRPPSGPTLVANDNAEERLVRNDRPRAA